MGHHGVDEAPSERALTSFVVYGAFLVLLPLVLLAGTVAVASDLPAAIRAAQGRGESGSFEIQGEQCARFQPCDWIGEFSPSGGGAARGDVYFTGSGDAVGDVVAAVDTGAADRVFSPTSNVFLIASMLQVALLVVALIAWGTAVFHWRGRIPRGDR